VSVRRVAKIRVDVESVGGLRSARSDYDHRLRLSDSLPGLRLVEVDTSFVTGHGFTRCEFTPRRQSPGCRRTLPKRTSAKVLLHKVDTSHRLCPKCVRSTVEESTMSKSRSNRTLHELDNEETFFVDYGETVVTPCGLLQNQFCIPCSPLDVETNTMMCV
jgi:hypothetical protein